MAPKKTDLQKDDLSQDPYVARGYDIAGRPVGHPDFGNLDAPASPKPKKPPRRKPIPSVVEAPEAHLVGVHNLSQDNLQHADEHFDGSLIAPSIAVTHKDHPFTSFGDVTLVAGPHIVDPKKTPVFNADVYSPRHPRPNFKVNEKEAKKFKEWLRPHVDKAVGPNKYLDVDDVVERRGHQDVAQNYDTEAAMKLAWLQEVKHHSPVVPMRPARLDHPWADTPAIREFAAKHGINHHFENGDDYHRALSEAADRAARQKADGDAEALRGEDDSDADVKSDSDSMYRSMKDSAFTDDGLLYGHAADKALHSIKKLDTTEVDPHQFRGNITADHERLDPTGKEFKEWAHAKTKPLQGPAYLPYYNPNTGNRRKLPYDVHHVLREMTRTIKGGEGFNYGTGNARAMGARKFKTLAEMRAGASKLVPDEEMDKHKEVINERFHRVADKLTPYHGHDNSFMKMDAIVQSLGESFKPGRTLRGELAKDGFKDVPEDVIAELHQFGRDLLDSPTQYFEAKPQRAVHLSEFSGAVVPDDASPKTHETLKRHGVRDIETYPREDAQARRAAVERLATRQKLMMSEREAAEEELEKGAMQRLHPVSPTAAVTERSRVSGEDWSSWDNQIHGATVGRDMGAWSGGNASARERLASAPGAAEGEVRARMLHRLHGDSTSVRRGPTGGREFLLHRGYSGDEAGLVSDGKYTNDSASSWTPSEKIAKRFSSHGGGYASAWVPEERVGHYLAYTGSSNMDRPERVGAPDGQFRREQEVVVSPGSLDVHAVVPHQPAVKSEADLEKAGGAMSRLHPFNPAEISPNEEHEIAHWQGPDRYDYREPNEDDDGDAIMGGADVPNMDPNAKARAIHRLSSETEMRRDPETGERQFLLHRGPGHEEHAAATKDMDWVQHDRPSSWTPHYTTARNWAADYQKEGHKTLPMKQRLKPVEGAKVLSAWIPESSIEHVPLQYGRVSENPNRDYDEPKPHGGNDYRPEHEVVVAPHKSPRATALDMQAVHKPLLNLDRRISSRSTSHSPKMENMRQAYAGQTPPRPALSNPGQLALPNVKSELEKSEHDEVSLILVTDGTGRILLGRRADDGRWSMPGGHANPGEAPIDAARRELAEETGLQVERLSLLTVIPPEDGRPWLHCFTAHATGTPHTRDDPDRELGENEWEWIDCRGGLPANVFENLHGPDDDKNVLHRIFDLKKDEDVEWLKAGFAVPLTKAIKEDLGHAAVDEYGVHFETGHPVSVKFIRHSTKAPNYGERFQQHIEPHGRYMLHQPDPGPDWAGPGREAGVVEFKNPLVIHQGDNGYDDNSWKARLHRGFGAKGKRLSQKIAAAGHDAVVTVHPGDGTPRMPAHTSEIVDLTSFHAGKSEMEKAEEDVPQFGALEFGARGGPNEMKEEQEVLVHPHRSAKASPEDVRAVKTWDYIHDPQARISSGVPRVNYYRQPAYQNSLKGFGKRELDPELTEVQRLLRHPDPVERRMALKLPGVTQHDLAQAILDPDPQVYQTAFKHPDAPLDVLANASRDAAGAPCFDRHVHLLTDPRCRRQHVEDTYAAVRDDAALPVDVRARHLRFIAADPRYKHDDLAKHEGHDVVGSATLEPHEALADHAAEEVPPHLQGLRDGFDNISHTSPLPNHGGLPWGTVMKAVHKDTAGNTYMVKPYHQLNPRNGTHAALAGWGELTNQALYHSAGIGHLHQKVVPAKYGDHPAIVIGIEHAKPVDEVPHDWHENEQKSSDAWKIAAMDHLVANTDRAPWNLMQRSDGSLMAIDHGYAFHNDEHDRPVMSPAEHEQERHLFTPPDKSNKDRGTELGHWWAAHGPDVKRTLADRAELIRDPDVKARVINNFGARAKWWDDLADKAKAGGVNANWMSEPIQQPEVKKSEEMDKAEGSVMYHWAPKAARNDIARHGLDHRRSSGYDPKSPGVHGNYLHHTESAARDWVPDIDRTHDLYQVNAAGLDLRPDPYDTGDASYTPKPVSPGRLKLVSDVAKSLGASDFLSGQDHPLKDAKIHAALPAPPEVHQHHVDRFATHVGGTAQAVNPENTKLGGIESKAVYPAGSERYLVKPFYSKTFPAGGWGEMTSQAMYHAAGIGHLHQAAHVVDSPAGPGVAIHMEPGTHTLGWDLQHKEHAFMGGPKFYEIGGGNTERPLDSFQKASRFSLARRDHAESLRRIALMDKVTANGDRHQDNVLLRNDGSPMAIDHGAAFRHDHMYASGERSAPVRSWYGRLDAAAGKPTSQTWAWYDKAKPMLQQTFDSHVDALPGADYRAKMRESFAARLAHIDSVRAGK